MEEEIKKLIKGLTEALGSEIIAIIYNPRREEGMKEADCKFLKHILISRRHVSPLFILNGNGGDFVSGVFFPYIIRNSVKNYAVYIPRICCSALCYTLLKANRLLVGENTIITQIDPTFQYKGEVRRAVKVMKSKKINDRFLIERAREIFSLAEGEVRKLIASPSLFRERKLKYYEHMQMDDLASLFMNKGDHYDEVSIKELEKLGAKVEDLRNWREDTVANELIFKCQDFTIENDVRVVFVSSRPIEIKGEEGTLICPLA